MRINFRALPVVYVDVSQPVTQSVKNQSVPEIPSLPSTPAEESSVFENTEQDDDITIIEDNDVIIIDDNDSSDSSYLVEKKEVHEEDAEDALKCICGLRFVRESLLHNHVNSKLAPGTELACKDCGSWFLTPKCLMKHKKKKHNLIAVTPNKKAFSSKNTSTSDQLTKDKVRCEVCDTEVRGLSNLYKHMVVDHLIFDIDKQQFYNVHSAAINQ